MEKLIKLLNGDFFLKEEYTFWKKYNCIPITHAIFNNICIGNFIVHNLIDNTISYVKNYYNEEYTESYLNFIEFNKKTSCNSVIISNFYIVFM